MVVSPLDRGNVWILLEPYSVIRKFWHLMSQGSIDPESAELIKSSMWKIRSQNDRILIVITHNRELLEGFDKIIEMSNGKAQIIL